MKKDKQLKSDNKVNTIPQDRLERAIEYSFRRFDTLYRKLAEYERLHDNKE